MATETAWPQYGKVLRRYSGAGAIRASGVEAHCNFRCVQLVDGRILVRCECEEMSAQIHAGERSMTIEGNEDSGERFYVGEGRTTRTTHKIPDGTGTVEVLASHAEI